MEKVLGCCHSKNRQGNKNNENRRSSRPKRITGLFAAGIFFFLGIALMLLTIGCGRASAPRTAYKVLIGAAAEQLMDCRNCDLLVVDAESLTAEQVEKLHQNGNKEVFSYLNIGSIERFRADYEEFSPLTLSDYQDWLEERWVNVAARAWQDRIAAKAEELMAKGIDGLFLDNADIYYQYPNEDIYQGLLAMLKQLNTVGKPLMINGGDAFVQKAMAADDLRQLIAAVNQETVFTAIDFAAGSFGRRTAEDREYYQAYLARCREYGLTVYLLEYGATGELAQEIAEYCRQNGFFYAIADSLELER